MARGKGYGLGGGRRQAGGESRKTFPFLLPNQLGPPRRYARNSASRPTSPESPEPKEFSN